MPLKGKSLFRASTTLVAVGFLLFGYDQGVMSGIITNENWLELMGQPSPAVIGAVVALYEIGCMFGALSVGAVSDWIGRKNTIRIGSIILIIGAVLQTAQVDLAMAIVSRIITGVGNGMITATVPVYQSEIAPPTSRGASVCYECTLLVVGMSIAYWLEFGLYWAGGVVAWRFPLAFQIVFALTLLAGTTVLPETPRWLVSKDRDEEAKMVLARLWTNEDTTHPRCVDEYEEIKQGINMERRLGISSYQELFSKGKYNNRYRVCLGMLSQAIQQLSGINATTYYLTTVFENAGFTRPMAMMFGGVDTLVYAIGSLVPIFFVEKVGRRPIMLWGLVAQAVTLMALAGSQAASDGYKAGTWHLAGGQGGAAAFTMLYNFVFGASWLSMAWLYPAELFSTAMRAKGNSLSTASNWLFNFVVAEITPVLFSSIGFYTYILFGFLNIAFIPVVYYWFPETKGKTLEEVRGEKGEM
ncbi:general substrate transporter [Hesseltinella vesiculosa]|uniref:General substrate transporter n=1 Tax=Hesseltinella vesiculosa TaxID=101127 RepID=A0A1X2GG36_9FUNG|nr:general substrate transporter [Hesseltinella vesiculosa]